MSDQIYALLDSAGTIVNRVVGSPENAAGLTAVLETDAPYYLGGTLIAGVYTPPAAPTPIPFPITSVTPRQARLALLGAGLLDQVQAAVDAAGGATKITWEYATDINRNDPLIVNLGQTLGLTSVQIDNLFIVGATL